MACHDKDDILGGFGWNYAILDTGCNKSVAGNMWMEEYLAVLRNKDRRKVDVKQKTQVRI